MNLVIINECNRECSFCCEGPFKQSPRQVMTPGDVERLCQFFRLEYQEPGYEVCLMGGEATLHPQLIEIVDLIRSYNPYTDVRLLTNLTCGRELTNELLRRRVRLMVNLGRPEYNTAEQEEAIRRNTDLLAQAPDHPYSVGITVTHPDESFAFLYDLLRRDAGRAIANVRIGLASPGYQFQNAFITNSPRFGETYMDIVTNCHQINPRLLFNNECPVNLCTMSEDIYNQLKPVVSNLTIWSPDCLKMDILPDFSTHWCFAFESVPEMRVENVLNYGHMDAVRGKLMQQYHFLSARVGPQCNFDNCTSFQCRGMCLAMNYYRWSQQNG